MMKTVLLLSALVAGALAECPDIPALTEFDASQYAGQWYEIARYPLIGELGETCVQANYTLQSDASVRLENRAKKPDGSIDSIQGTASAKDPSKPAELSVVFDEGFRGSYNVIRTNYNASAMVYACNSVFGIANEYTWFLSRTETMDQRVVDEFTKILVDAGSDTSKLYVTPQDCGSIF